MPARNSRKTVEGNNAPRRTGISIPMALYERAVAERVSGIQKQFPEYTFSDYIRDLLRKDLGMPTSTVL